MIQAFFSWFLCFLCRVILISKKKKSKYISDSMGMLEEPSLILRSQTGLLRLSFAGEEYENYDN